MKNLRQRGFEVGVHGLKHNGRLFDSKASFLRNAKRINRYLKEWNAEGFRAELMLRNPEWMQALDVEYDLSFFDTDPFEPVPGGTMSIWALFIGHFVELPYTLVQDHTLLAVLGEYPETMAGKGRFYGGTPWYGTPELPSGLSSRKFLPQYLPQFSRGHARKRRLLDGPAIRGCSLVEKSSRCAGLQQRFS